MAAYYNEINRKKAAALRALIADGFIAAGDVDERSIVDVRASDLIGYTQCHFFAGIGLWSYALRRAGVPDNEPVWTGSCPCQPFSSAGNKAAQSDERHLWPYWARLIRESKPTAIYGEQVDDAIATGWLDDAFHDLEAEDYACAASVLPACSVNSPHPRDRLWFVAYPNSKRELWLPRKESGKAKESQREMGETQRERLWLFDSGVGNVENSQCSGLSEQGISSIGNAPAEDRKASDAFYASEIGDYTWLEGPDGKCRPVKPGICLLVDGYPERYALLHAAGDGINIELAAEFIKATM